MRISQEKSSLLKDLKYDPKKQALIVTYRDDSATLIYFRISPGLAAAIQRHPHPGEVWSRIRHNYKPKRVD